MPEGFNSVADLKIIVDANADKFHSSVQGVLQSLGELDQNGNKSLSGLDKMMAAVGDASIGVSGKFKMLAAGVEAGVALYKQFASEGRAVAEMLGVTSEYDKLIATIDDLGMSLMDGAVGAFFAVQSAGMDAKAAMFGFADATSVGDQNAKSFASTLLEKVTSAFNAVRLELRLFNAEMATNAKQIDTTVGLAASKAAELRERIREMDAGEAPTTRNVYSRGGTTTIDLRKEAQRELNRLIERTNELETIRASLPGQDWIDGTKTHINLLASEVEGLERRNATLGMSAAAAAEYNAIQKATDEAMRQGIDLTPEYVEYIEKQAAVVRHLTQVKEDNTKAEQDRQRAEQQAMQRDRAVAQTYANAERELTTLKARADAVGLNARETAELVMYERLLQQLRASGAEVNDAEIVKIRAIAAEYGRTTEAMAESQQQLREFGEVGQAVAGGLSSAFARWASGAKVDVKSMVASVLADLAQLTLRRSALEPLFGGGSSGGNGLFGDVLGSLFGGFRADGGDVNAGMAYVVGERGPEMFIPKNAGTIVPNGQNSGRTGGEVHVYVHGTPDFDARVVSNAEGVVARRAPGIIGQSVAAVQQTREAYGLD